MSRASKIVNRDIKSATRVLNQKANRIRKNTRFGVNQTNAQYNRAKGDLDYIAGETQDYVGSQNTKINNMFGSTRSGLQGLANDLQAKLGANHTQVRQGAMNELTRLGMQGNVGLGSIDADAANAQNVASQTGSNNLANLDTMRAGSSEIGELLKSMIQGSRQSAVGQAMNDRNDSVSLMRQKKGDAMQSIFDEIFNLRKDRRSKIQALRGSFGGGSGSSSSGSGSSSVYGTPETSAATSRILTEASKRKQKRNIKLFIDYQQAYANAMSGKSPNSSSSAGGGGSPSEFK